MEIEFHTEQRKINDLVPYEHNPRQMTQKQVDDLTNSLKKFSLAEIPVINTDNTIIAGHQRLKILQRLQKGEETIDVRVPNRQLTEEEVQEYNIRSNKNTGDWDFDILANSFNYEDLKEWGFNESELKGFEDKPKAGILAEKFLAPPFTILDAKQKYWLDRKYDWFSMIGDFGETREDTLGMSSLQSEDYGRDMPTMSILDPVLAEICVKWFAPTGGTTFDMFAGDTVFGFVSGYLGYPFTGIELRQEQADLNQERVDAFGLPAKYICDDGQNVANHLANDSQDFMFSCPPYFDLEVYSDLPNDASNQEDYQDFLKIIDNALTAGVKILKDNRFAVIVVGDIRDNDGFYYNFPDDIKTIMLNAGMKFYNEAVLITPLGTAPIRANNAFKNRKLVKVHQNVMVFYKGNPRSIQDNFSSIDFKEVLNANEDSF